MSYLYVIIQAVFIVIIGITSKIPSNLFIVIGLIGGVVLMLWSLKTMQLCNLNVFPGLKEKSPLITSGPYKTIRHPMYAAVLLITLMLILTNPTLLRFGYWIILSVDLYLKLRYEESLLSKKFPDYAAYKTRTKLLIPFVF